MSLCHSLILIVKLNDWPDRILSSLRCLWQNHTMVCSEAERLSRTPKPYYGLLRSCSLGDISEFGILDCLTHTHQPQVWKPNTHMSLQLHNNKLIEIARRAMKCLATKRTTRSQWNSDFNQIIQVECSDDEVFPLMRAAAVACGCELNAMTTAQVRSVKQAWLEDINRAVGAVKASIKSVKVEEEEDSSKMASLNESFDIMKSWYFFIYLNKVPVEGEDVEHAAITTPQRQSKRARTAVVLAE